MPILLDALAHGVLVHADVALRQLSFSQQEEIVNELRRRIDVRRAQPGALQYGQQVGCRGKRRYETEEQARRALRHHQNAERMRPYTCHVCDHYHLGHPSVPPKAAGL
jgi:hypothetical protein